MVWRRRFCGCGRCFSWLFVLCLDIQDGGEKVEGTQGVGSAGQGHCWAVAVQQELAQEEMVWETGGCDGCHPHAVLYLPAKGL